MYTDIAGIMDDMLRKGLQGMDGADREHISSYWQDNRKEHTELQGMLINAVNRYMEGVNSLSMAKYTKNAKGAIEAFIVRYTGPLKQD